ncbi:MAG TPA: Glu/Leu/Phe/Val dehydrogenase dimerization domain-containing protein [Chitinophagales bacterium]|nr:Glu/Leu/Phe/Val dehydrogenase dimerization domain-containing protein [Chitinophagales bacterium]HMW13376.1 Glu/Leu/Phe/Val dehydrogenase dimerization domain-containing protein [Chitinophagales bacterium]HMX60584.1 Glu/Leu/Phe/Val dehydrogenase dimerization domain-containing protein [Chitinophagales bacterium]HMY23968.1 Glu/Leu/Phe/Val dehydrogenase dimerization domain-containing protein [Chitinophagales bacterium]HMZ34602.1 Glu/Leu/Phe/Val dehydrogenase dimerization domain-containing protein
MSNFIKPFEDKAPEIVFEWNDSKTDAQGWLVINSLRGGAAGGGTRMRKGLTKHEVISLAKTMEIKFSVSGPAIGGAKSGINFDPNDTRKREVLERWYKTVAPILKSYYGTGGDMNIDEIDEVIPITEEYGIWHPQEGIVNGHYHPKERDKINKIGQLRVGVSKLIEDEDYTPSKKEGYLVADMITGYGVAESVKHYYNIYKNEDIKGKKATIQGFGNVGAAAAYFLAQQGVKIAAIIDITGILISKNGLDFEQVKKLFLQRKNNKLSHPDLLPFDKAQAQFWNTKADIFIPAAGSRFVNEDNLTAMQNAGIEVISSGANVPFNDPEIFYGKVLNKADSSLAVIPDFIANCGMARVFAYLMHKNVKITDDAIFQDVSKTIYNALVKVYEKDNRTIYLTKNALQIAIDELS